MSRRPSRPRAPRRVASVGGGPRLPDGRLDWAARFSAMDATGVDGGEVHPDEAAREVLDEAFVCAQHACLEALYEISFGALPYLLQHAPPESFIRTAAVVAPALAADGDVDTALQWVQYAAIMMRRAGRFEESIRTTVHGAAAARRHGLTVREAYLEVTQAAAWTAAGGYREAADAVGRARWAANAIDDELTQFSFLAQADLEMVRLNHAVMAGDEAAQYADRASDHFRNRSRTAFANGLIQGYQALSHLYAGRNGHAYLYGLRSLVTLLFERHFPGLRELVVPAMSDTLGTIYGVGEERELARFLGGLEPDRLPSRLEIGRAQTAASRLYLFHLEYHATPREVYDNPLREACERFARAG